MQVYHFFSQNQSLYHNLLQAEVPCRNARLNDIRIKICAIYIYIYIYIYICIYRNSVSLCYTVLRCYQKVKRRWIVAEKRKADKWASMSDWQMLSKQLGNTLSIFSASYTPLKPYNFYNLWWCEHDITSYIYHFIRYIKKFCASFCKIQSLFKNKQKILISEIFPPCINDFSHLSDNVRILWR